MQREQKALRTYLTSSILTDYTISFRIEKKQQLSLMLFPAFNVNLKNLKTKDINSDHLDKR